MAKNKSTKKSFYNIERFGAMELMKMQQDISDYAQAIGGLPKHHSEALLPEKRGWQLPFLFGYDSILHGRWDYWTDILMKGTIEGSGPIPKIEFGNLQNERGYGYTYKMLSKCLNDTRNEGNIETFADWLLWGLGYTEEPPQISAELNYHYYRNFDMFLVLDFPTDYMSHLLSESSGKGYKAALGYYPTPMSVTTMMAEMVCIEQDPEVLKRQTFYEPCVGCGAIMLPMSNYVLRGSAQDTSPIAIKLCIIQMHWYAPWFAKPANNLKGFDEKEVGKQREVTDIYHTPREILEKRKDRIPSILT